MTSVACTEERHSSAILAIFNEAIQNSTALYDYKPRTMEMIAAWFETKRRGGFPVIGCEDTDGTLMGFASYGTFRAWPAYKYSVEHSVYIDTRFRGRGLGVRLMQELIATATDNNVHMLIGGIDASNAASIALHKKLGFDHCATIKHAGYKFGRWLDLVFYQLILSTPENPTEDIVP